MNSYKLIYKPVRIGGLYDQYIQKLKSKQVKQKKQAFYQKILKFKSSRYPKQFINFLQNQIDPFQYSLQTLKAKMNQMFPQYSEEVINQSVQYIYKQKYQQNKMISQSPTIIEEGDQYIRNGRRLLKQEFIYKTIDKPLPDQSSLFLTDRNQSRSIIKKSGDELQNSDRGNQISSRRYNGYNVNGFISSPEYTDRMSPRKKSNNQIQSRNQLFNQILAEQIKKQSKKLDPIEIIHEDEQNDILILNSNEEFKRYGYTDRTLKDQSFPKFKDSDIQIQPEALITGRSEVQQLNEMLEGISMIPEQKGVNTSRSNQYSIRINKENYYKLYDAKGNLKIDIVKRAVNRIKNQY